MIKEEIPSVNPKLDSMCEMLKTIHTLNERNKMLEAQIEKMKNCKNCANYMISGKCPRLFRTGWCKNWEMTRSKK